MCAGPHTGRHENGASGGPIWSAAPHPSADLGTGRRSGAADREVARQSPRRHTGSPPARRQGLKTPGYEKRPLKGAQDAYALREPALAGFGWL